MKHAVLKSVAHNIADSLASGIGLMIGIYEMDVFGDPMFAYGWKADVDLRQDYRFDLPMIGAQR